MANAKRTAPAVVEPATHEGLTYSAPHFVPGESQNGGFIEARTPDGALLWRSRIFTTDYDDGEEADTQDRFINELTIERGILVAIDEGGRIFHIDPKTRDVQRVK